MKPDEPYLWWSKNVFQNEILLEKMIDSIDNRSQVIALQVRFLMKSRGFYFYNILLSDFRGLNEVPNESKSGIGLMVHANLSISTQNIKHSRETDNNDPAEVFFPSIS